MRTVVIFGATGDLTRRKLIPALYNLQCKGALDDVPQIVGFSIEDYDLDAFRERLRGGVEAFSPASYDSENWAAFAEKLHYFKGNLKDVDSFHAFESYLAAKEDGPADRLYYLAITPTLYEETVVNLGAAGMSDESEGERRVIIEKPFGRDLASAHALNETIRPVFEEHQVYRIDHYLGKETAQNILFFRFANHVFESVWDRTHIDHVQITVAENVDVGHRAGYYDKSGVLRDMFQNHLLQLLTLVAMEPPASFEADELRNEKVKVLRSVRPIDIDDTVRGQYEGYIGTDGVDANSQTPTFAALKLYVDNWRWQGVPFYLRSGKTLPRKITEVVIQFKRPPRAMFNSQLAQSCNANTLSLCIQPDEGIHFNFDVKVPATSSKTHATDMEFHYSNTFGENAIPEAYERLLLDAITGDASLFIRRDEIETAWRIVDPVIQAWGAGEGPALATYPRDTWGPDEAHDLIVRDGFWWQLGCAHD